MKLSGPSRILLAFLGGLVLVTGALAYSLSALVPRTTGRQVTIDRLQQLGFEHRVKTATFREVDGRLVLRTPQSEEFWAAVPAQGAESAVIFNQMVTAGAAVSVDQQWDKRVLTIFAQFILPLLLMANLFGIFMIVTRSGGGASQVKELFAFSRIGARRARVEAAGVTFKDVAGASEAVLELSELRDFLADPARFKDIGAVAPRGVLLYGPPGCGKTLLARSLAGEAGVPFYSISGAEFVESLVGVGAARVRDLFATARKTAPCIVFVDELDAAGRKRGAGLGGGNDEREQTLNELLVQMDGFEPSSGIIVIAATNRPDILDPALLRPGRFDRHIAVETPAADGRLEILRLHSRRCRLAESASLETVSRMTPGFSGADLANVVNEAALLAVRRGGSEVTTADLVEGVHRVRSGPRRKGRVLSEAEVRRLAYHEAGHAVAASMLDAPLPHRVSIVSRGRAIGGTDLLPSAERTVIGREELLDEVTLAVAGIAAEELVVGSSSTAGEGDLELATELARRFAGRFGMSETVGRVRVAGRDAEVFLGRDYMSSQNLSPRTQERVDDAVREVVEEAVLRATKLLKTRRSTLDALASRLMVEETIDGTDLERLLEGEAAA